MKCRKSILILLSISVIILLIFITSNSSQVNTKNSNIYNSENNLKETFRNCNFKTKDGKQGLIDSKGNIIIEAKYNSLSPAQNNMVVFKENDKFGVMDLNENLILEPNFNFISILNADYIYTADDSGLHSYYDNQGHLILSSENGEIISYLDKDLFVSLNDKNQAMLLNKDKEVLIPYEYNYQDFLIANEDIVIGIKRLEQPNGIETKSVYLNLNGEPLFDQTFEGAEKFINDIAIVSNEYDFGAIDKNGNILIDLKFQHLSPFYNGIAVAKTDDKYGLLDTSFNFIIDPSYEYLGPNLYDSFLIASKDGKFGAIDTDENIKIPFEYNEVKVVENDKVQLTKENKISFVTKENKIIVPSNEYDKVTIFDNLLITNKNNNINLIDLTSGNSILTDKNFIEFNNSSPPDGIIELKDEDSTYYYLDTITNELIFES